MIRAVMFDLDGTLLDTLQDIADAMNRSLLRSGLAPRPVPDYRYLVGNGAVKLAERVTGGRPDLRQAVYDAYMADYARNSLRATRPYPGIPELLSALRGRGLKLAVVSNQPDSDTRHVIRHFFGDAFDQVRGQRPDTPVKPDPAGPLAVAEALGIPPQAWLYLGDTSVDMTCALRAGMRPIGAAWGFREERELWESGAARVIRAPAELLALAFEEARGSTDGQGPQSGPLK